MPGAMKSSQYNYLIRNSTETMTLWNTRTGAFETVSLGEGEQLQKGSFNSLDPARREHFLRIGAIVPLNMDEAARVAAEIRRNAETAPFCFRILVTTACNAACEYCYEKGQALSTMSRETARQTAEFIIQKSRGGKSPVELEWFGGEPLLNVPVISHICDELRANNVRYYSRITTNGLLWNPWLIRTAAELWNVKRVQITVDGIGAEYERIKRVPERSFAALLEQIHELLELQIRVRIRVNDTGNTTKAKEVVKLFRNEFGTPENLRIYMSPLYRGTKAVPAADMERVLDFNEELFRQGFAEADSYYRLNPSCTRCFACSPNGYTITPDGDIVACSHTLGKENAVGTVWKTDEEVLGRKEYTDAPLSRECLKCMFLPLCGGGCRTGELKRAGMFQCFPYRSVMEKIAIRRMQK